MEQISDKERQQLENSVRMARNSFRYFWREVFWNLQRAHTLCNYAAVLCNFGEQQGETVVNEKLWLINIQCDGVYIHGELENKPQHLHGMQQGEIYTVPIEGIDDWMYVIHGRVYGAYSINLFRAKMKAMQLEAHDKAWGYNFGSPTSISMFPRTDSYKKEEEEEEEEELPKPTKFFGITISQPKKKNAPIKIFGITIYKPKIPKQPPSAEQLLGLSHVKLDEIDQIKDHPLALEMESSILQQLHANPNLVHAVDNRGWSLLHHHALAGSRHIVRALLKAGANPFLPTPEGHLPRNLAKVMHWRQAMSIISDAERGKEI